MESTGLRDDAFTNVPGGDSVQGEPEGTRPIDISRKITACVACRKQKVCVQVHGIRPRTNEVAHVVDNNDPKHQIKCHMPQGQAPCVRCRKRGLSCTVNRSLQMLIQDHTTYVLCSIRLLLMGIRIHAQNARCWLIVLLQMEICHDDKDAELRDGHG